MDPRFIRNDGVGGSNPSCGTSNSGNDDIDYVPLSFAPGEAYQFDWSHEVVLLSGVTVTVKADRDEGCASERRRNHRRDLCSRCA
jgi:hypothetical protein